MSAPLKAPPKALLIQVVCDGIYLYGLRSNNTLWVSLIDFPLAWKQLPAVPFSENIIWIGVTMGSVKSLPDEALFAIADKTGNLYFFNGVDWRQESGPL